MKVTFEEEFQGSEGVNQLNPWWKNITGRRESNARAPRWELPRVFEQQGGLGS